MALSILYFIAAAGRREEQAFRLEVAMTNNFIHDLSHEILFNYGMMLSDQGRLDQACRLLERLVERATTATRNTKNFRSD